MNSSVSTQREVSLKSADEKLRTAEGEKDEISVGIENVVLSSHPSNPIVSCTCHEKQSTPEPPSLEQAVESVGTIVPKESSPPPPPSKIISEYIRRIKGGLEYVNLWKDNKYIVTVLPNELLAMNLWVAFPLVLAMVDDSSDLVLSTLNLPKTRFRLGLITCPERNIIMHAHLMYGEPKGQFIKIEFYACSDINNVISLIREYSFSVNLSFSGTTGRVCKINNDTLTIAFGDPYNDDNFYFLCCNEKEVLLPLQQSCAPLHFYTDYLTTYYYINKDKILAARVLATENYYLIIRLDNQMIKKQFVDIRYYQSPYKHGFLKFTEMETCILDMSVSDGTVYYLIRFLTENENLKKEKEYFAVDLLIDSQNNEVISTQKIKLEEKSFGVQSWIKLDSTDGNRIPVIWSKAPES
jgi:hypothetical protein